RLGADHEHAAALAHARLVDERAGGEQHAALLEIRHIGEVLLAQHRTVAGFIGQLENKQIELLAELAHDGRPTHFCGGTATCTVAPTGKSTSGAARTRISWPSSRSIR